MRDKPIINKNDLFRVLNQTQYEYSLKIKNLVETRPEFHVRYADEDTLSWRQKTHDLVGQFLNGELISINDLRTNPSKFFKLYANTPVGSTAASARHSLRVTSSSAEALLI